MDKSPWGSQNVISILGVSQVMSQKVVLSFYKSMSPFPSPPNTMLKDQRNCALTVSTLSVGWGEGIGTYSVSSARIQFRVFVKKRPNCTTVPRLLSMIVGLLYIVVGYIEIPLYYTNKIIPFKAKQKPKYCGFWKAVCNLSLNVALEWFTWSCCDLLNRVNCATKPSWASISTVK